MSGGCGHQRGGRGDVQDPAVALRFHPRQKVVGQLRDRSDHHLQEIGMGLPFRGQVAPGDVVAIVGAGPIGLATLLTAQFYTPAEIIMVDVDDNRLAVAKQFGATHIVNSQVENATEQIMRLTENKGVDVAIEAVGIPATIELCQAIIAAGGRIANVGVHGKSVPLHLETLWSKNITITTRLVDTVSTPMLIKTHTEKK